MVFDSSALVALVMAEQPARAVFDAIAGPDLAGIASAGAAGVTADQRFLYAPHVTVSRSDLMRIDLGGHRER